MWIGIPDRPAQPTAASTTRAEGDADGRGASVAVAEPALAAGPSTSAGFLLGMPMAAGMVTSAARASAEAAMLSALLLRHRFGSVLPDRPDDAQRPAREQAVAGFPTAELGPGDLRHLGHLAGAATLRAVQLERTAQHERVADTYELTQAVVQKSTPGGVWTAEGRTSTDQAARQSTSHWAVCQMFCSASPTALCSS